MRKTLSLFLLAALTITAAEAVPKTKPAAHSLRLASDIKPWNRGDA
jgi:hypothetical protein